MTICLSPGGSSDPLYPLLLGCGLWQAVVDKYVKAIDADKDAALSPRDAFRPGHEGGASPLSGRMAALRASGESPLSEITHVVVVRRYWLLLKRLWAVSLIRID